MVCDLIEGRISELADKILAVWLLFNSTDYVYVIPAANEIDWDE